MRRPGQHRLDGMTLIELILVMALLATILAITSPSLEHFFGGRSVNGQARRLLELTRYGQSEAISSGIPMDLWIDPQAGKFGLSPASGYGYEAPKPVTFLLDPGQKFDMADQKVDEGPDRNKGKADTVGIIFLPDGRIEEGSLESVVVVDKKKDSLTIRRMRDEDGNALGSKFEVVTTKATN